MSGTDQAADGASADARRRRPRALRPRRARALPSDLGACGWLEAAPAGGPVQQLGGSEQADCAVLGAGFTGLAAARRLARLRPGWRIAVLEAQQAGDGASGRSSGFVVDAASSIAAMPEAVGQRFVRLSRAGIDSLKQCVDEHGIECAWDDRGWLHAAAGDAGERSLKTLTAWLVRTGARHEVLDRDGVAAVTGSRFYRCAVRLPGSVLVQAGALVRGLAGCLPASVTLFERSPVIRIEHGFTLTTPAGSLRAPRLVIALNAWSPSLGVLGQRVFPLLTFGSLSRPLDEREQTELGGERTWGILAQDPMGSSLRRTADQRLLVRNDLCYRRDVRCSKQRRAAAQTRHRQALARRFPALGALPFESTWAGPMAAVPNLQPFFGRIAPQAVAVAGFTGAGIAMGTALGARAADVLCAEDHPGVSDAMGLAGPRWLPPEPFLSPGIAWRVRRMNAAAGDLL